MSSDGRASNGNGETNGHPRGSPITGRAVVGHYRVKVFVLAPADSLPPVPSGRGSAIVGLEGGWSIALVTDGPTAEGAARRSVVDELHARTGQPPPDWAADERGALASIGAG